MKQKRWTNTVPCFYCGVDSEELKWFLGLVIGGLVLSSVLIGVGAYFKGMFRNQEDVKHKIFEFEKRK